MKTDLYQVVTDRIITLLESGTIPWRKPWTGGQPPQNLMSRRPYGGVNVFLLNASRFASPYWLTFLQLQALGARVRKGEKAFPIVFWKLLEREGEEKPIPYLRYHNVFNVEQCEDLRPSLVPVTETKPFRPIEQCEKVVADMPKCPVINEGPFAGYLPASDEILMPGKVRFESPESYYCTLFHELTHSTGHSSRLSRKEITEANRFGSDPYSREELVAEMGAAFLSGHCQIEMKTVENSAAYLQGWLGRLKDDRKLVIHAAAQAQKACNFILNTAAKREEEAPPRSEPKEFKVVALRECPTPMDLRECDTPDKAVEYWRLHVVSNPQFNSECECFAVLFLNTRRRVKGHQLISIGTLDTILVHAREVFRGAIIAAASAIVIIHNHPSGDPTPSESDIKVTRDLIRAGQLLKIEVLDHVVVGKPGHTSLRSMGYFHT